MSILTKDEMFRWIKSNQDRINRESNQRIVIRDLKGLEVKKIKTLKGESASDIFQSLVESEGWAADALLKSLKLKDALLEELDEEVGDEDLNSISINISVRGKLHYKVTLEGK